MSKIISQEAIENLKSLIRNRNSYLDIKEVLDNLEDVKSQDIKLDESQAPKKVQQVDVIATGNLGDVSGCLDILKDLKELLHKGRRSQIHEFEIRDIINKYGNKDEKQ